MPRSWLTTLIFPLIAAGCSKEASKPGPVDAAAELAAVRSAIAATNVKWADAGKRGDVQALSALVTEDITVMGVDGNDMVGRAAYVQNATRNYAARPFEVIDMQIVTESLEVHGDVAYEIGHDINVRRPKNSPNAAPDTSRARYFTFWRRGSDGTWRASRDFTVPTPKPAK